MTTPARPSLFAAVGGDEVFLALARAHHARCLADPELSHPFSGPDQHPRHVERLGAYWAEVMGGPPQFSRGCADVDDLGRRFLACFLLALDDAGVLDDPELRGCLRAYMEWAVGEMLAVALVAADEVPDGAVFPRWTWDGLAV